MHAAIVSASAGSPADGSSPAAARIAAQSPAAGSLPQERKIDDGEVGRLPQARHHARVQKRALPDAALAVEQRQPGGEQVGDHEVAFDVPAEEEGGVLLLVVVQALVGGAGLAGRREGGRAHGPAGICCSSASAASSAGTYSSRGTS